MSICNGDIPFQEFLHTHLTDEGRYNGDYHDFQSAQTKIVKCSDYGRHQGNKVVVNNTGNAFFAQHMWWKGYIKSVFIRMRWHSLLP